ncbi:large terminase [Gordonia tangerina]|uniref:Large terminase n=1 Tax=Gordonia tangerina TaxID=2911060 RepID=A0ABS9DKZ2_9ACTN|nr:large terminase [Gordonia tangerina]MCF3939905.1 large terminase [Gordonia tangerina]
MLLVVPGEDPEPWPTLGPQICDLIEDRAIYGPGSLQGEPYEIDPEFRAFIYRAFEVYPRGHEWAGRRRFKRVGLSVRKGLAKTEKQALIAFCELHPEGPTRFDGWDAHGNPVGRPVKSPYIPMLAVTVDQVEELAYGALKYIIEEGPDADLFDVTLERIVRLNERGRADGKAVPLANSPGSRDGARTTLNCFDEPHRLYLPRQLKAHQTMDANLPKRPLDDPWSLYVGTAGQPGQGSVAEEIHVEALRIAEGKIERPDLFYLYRTDDDPDRDLSDKDERIRAIGEATGPIGEFGPGQFDEIASKWDRPGADGPYLERVWLNRWRRQGDQAFDMKKIQPGLCRSGERLPKGEFVTLGFDGARFRDATAIVATGVESGLQELLGLWERPDDDEVDEWEVDEDEVTAVVADAMTRFAVWKMYADPPHWTETVGSWAARWPDRVEEWWTARTKPMAYTLREFREAIDSGSVTFGGGEKSHNDLIRHLGNAGRKELKLADDEGKPLDVMQKQDGRADLKFDAAMAAALSWKACLDARKSGARPPQPVGMPRRIY